MDVVYAQKLDLPIFLHGSVNLSRHFPIFDDRSFFNFLLKFSKTKFELNASRCRFVELQRDDTQSGLLGSFCPLGELIFGHKDLPVSLGVVSYSKRRSRLSIERNIHIGDIRMTT